MHTRLPYHRALEKENILRHIFLRHYVLLWVLVWMFGCSQSAPTLDVGGEEGGKVVSVIEELNEAKADDKKLAASFASKAVTPKAKELNLYSYYVKSTPKIQGDIAQCMVLVEKNDGTPLGDFEWELERKGDTWKIKRAPLVK